MNTQPARLAVAASLSLLAGCSGIGDGSTVESLKIVIDQASTTADQGFQDGDDKVVMYQCFCTNLGVLATFTDGSAANFVNRVKWTVIAGSNVKVFDGSDSAFFKASPSDADNTLCAASQRLRGALIASGPGTVTIKAEFSGLTDTLDVEVRPVSATDLEIRPVDPLVLAHYQADSLLAVPVGTSIDLATYFTPSGAGSDGREREVFGSLWSVKKGGVADTEFARFDSSNNGFITGLKKDAGASLTAQTVFPVCPAIAVDPLVVRVGDVAGLTLANDTRTLEGQPALRTADDGSHPLIVSTNEMLAVTGQLDFGGGTPAGAEQDLRSSVTIHELCSTVTCTDITDRGSCTTNADQFCDALPGGTALPVCSDTDATNGDPAPDPAVAICRTSAIRFSTALAPQIVPITFTAADGTAGTPSRFRASFDPTPTVTTDDPSAAGGYSRGNCPEVVCSPASDNVSATPVAGTFKSLAIDQPGPVTIGTPYGTAQLTATGAFDDAGTLTQKVTYLGTLNAVTWSSADARIASVSNAVATKGLVTAMGCPGDDDDAAGTDEDGTEANSVVIRLRATGGVAAPAESAAFTAAGNASCAASDLCADIVVQVSPLAAGSRPTYCD